MTSLTGTVVHGEGLGRSIGYPTANLNTDPSEEKGIFACTVKLNNSIHNGVAILGMKPQLSTGKEKTEVYIIDFDEDIYGKEITVTIQKKLRDLASYSTQKELIAQIERDINDTKKLLSK